MKQDISKANIQLENEGKSLPNPMIAPASGPSRKIHGPPLNPFHKLQLTPKISCSSEPVALSNVPGAKTLMCGLMALSISSVSTYLYVNVYEFQDFNQVSPRTQVDIAVSGAEPQLPP